MYKYLRNKFSNYVILLDLTNFFQTDWVLLDLKKNVLKKTIFVHFLLGAVYSKPSPESIEIS